MIRSTHTSTENRKSIYINEEALLGEVSKKEINDIFGRKTERKAVDFALLGPKMHLLGGKGKVRKKR